MGNEKEIALVAYFDKDGQEIKRWLIPTYDYQPSQITRDLKQKLSKQLRKRTKRRSKDE